MSDRYRIYGVELSPFSVKIRSYFRYKQIPHDWIVRNAATMADSQKFAKIPIIPLVVTPGEHGLQGATAVEEKKDGPVAGRASLAAASGCGVVHSQGNDQMSFTPCQAGYELHVRAGEVEPVGGGDKCEVVADEHEAVQKSKTARFSEPLVDREESAAVHFHPLRPSTPAHCSAVGTPPSYQSQSPRVGDLADDERVDMGDHV